MRSDSIIESVGGSVVMAVEHDRAPADQGRVDERLRNVRANAPLTSCRLPSARSVRTIAE